MYRDLSVPATLLANVNAPSCWLKWRKKSAGIKLPNLLSFRSYSSIFLPSRRRSEGIYFPKNSENGRHQMP